MKNISRRRFIRNGTAGMAGLAALGAIPGITSCSRDTMVDMVDLGRSGIKVPRIAFGTGTFGWKHESNQLHMGREAFVDLAKYCYDKGIRFLETADMYGTHEHVGAALKEFPRENVTVLTKVMTFNIGGWFNPIPFDKTLDQFRRELQTDYIDIMLLHALDTPNWPEDNKYYMDALSEAKQKGIIKTIGMSAHSPAAMLTAAEHPWVEVIMATLNHKGPRMGGTPSETTPILRKACENGKGVIGMKLFGCTQLVEEQEREESLNYVLNGGGVHCVTLGMEHIHEVDDNVERVMRIVNGRA